MKSIFAAAAMAAGVLVAQGADAQVQNWKIQTSAQAGDFYYKSIEKWLPVLTTMTGGKVKAELTPIGSVVPHNQTIDAVAQGILQGDLTSTVYFSGRDKAFALLGDLIAGYDTPWQVIQFCYYGGGREILQELFDKYGNKQIKVVASPRTCSAASVARRSRCRRRRPTLRSTRASWTPPTTAPTR
jgi:TRAP-type mannitol/chloroaromatic compound transport system substrate-binding protein